MGTLMQIALTACAAYSGPSEEISDTTEDERGGILAQMTSGAAGILRPSVTSGRHRTQMPRPTRPPSPEVCIGAGFAEHPTADNSGDRLRLTQEAGNSFAKLQYQEAVIEPPHTATEPRAPRGTEILLAVDADAVVRNRYGIKMQHLTAAHPA